MPNYFYSDIGNVNSKAFAVQLKLQFQKAVFYQNTYVDIYHFFTKMVLIIRSKRNFNNSPLKTQQNPKCVKDFTMKMTERFL